MTTESEVINKLDQLAEYHSQKDSIDAQKRAMLDDVKVPAEVEAIVSAAGARMAEVDRGYPAFVTGIRKQAQEQLDAIQVPEEIKAMLAEIDRKRNLIEDWQNAKEAEYREGLQKRKQAIHVEMTAQTRDVYAALEARKRDIEAEFSGKIGAVDANIKALEAEIKTDARECGKTVKGKYFMAVYVKGRVNWNTDMLDGMIALVPALEKARKEGEPSITLRKV